MTNLQVLLSKLDLTEEDEQKAIIENFNSQDEDEFIIDESMYKILSPAKVADEFYDLIEEEFSQLEDILIDSSYYYLFSYIDVEAAIEKKVQQMIDREELLPGYIFIGDCNRNYIYLVE
ncbi:MAG: hypothetical protein PF569_02535 [Candidatus Woesearchaeota archaeon]|nr:hypothetical protein [Candidatus Woesearchaeota archaeon]